MTGARVPFAVAVPVAILLVVILLAGCGLLAVPTPAPSGGSGANPGGGIVAPGPNDGALREQPDPAVVDARPTAVDHFVIGPDGRTVVVYYWGGNQGCYGLHSIEVEVRHGTPSITVNEGTRPEAAGKACTAEALLKAALITLAAPILRDASGGEPTPGEPQLPPQPLMVEPAPGEPNPNAHAPIGYSLTPDGLSLTVHYVGGTDECYLLAEASVTAAADGVSLVTIREGTLPNAGACDDIGVAKAVVVVLAASILRDGTLDAPQG